jgi:hypothetical protein
MGSTGCFATGGIFVEEAPDKAVHATELDLGGITGQDRESAFVGLLWAVVRDPMWFRMRLSLLDGRPGAAHDGVLYPERLCCRWCCCEGGGGSGDGWLIAGFWPDNELSLTGLTVGAFCEVNICPYGSPAGREGYETLGYTELGTVDIA